MSATGVYRPAPFVPFLRPRRAPFAVAAGGGPVTIAHNDAALRPYGWYVGASWLQSNTPGSYIKAKFTGVTGIKLNVDVSHLVAGGVGAGNYPRLKWSVDGGPWSALTQLTSASAQITLATGLAGGTHEALVVHAYNAEGVVDPWTAPLDSVRATGFEIDNGGAATAPTTLAALAYCYGDSIAMGSHAARGDAVNGDAELAYPARVALALGMEYLQIAFVGQQLAAGAGGGLGTTYALYDGAGHSRLAGGVFAVMPDEIFVNIGTNDVLTGGVSDATYQTNYNALLASLRTAAPSARLWVVVPFGGYKRSAIAGLTLPSNARVLDVDAAGTLVTPLLVNGTASRLSADGLHPTDYGHAVIAPLMVERYKAALGGTAGVRRVGLTGGISG